MTSYYYDNQVSLSGAIPPTTDHIHFTDTWTTLTMIGDLVWNHVSPAVCNISWVTWVDGLGFTAHPIGLHHIVATCFDVSNTVLGTYQLDKMITSVGSFQISPLGTTRLVPWANPGVYRTLNQESGPLFQLYWYMNDAELFCQFSFDEGFLSTTNISVVPYPDNSDIGGFPVFAVTPFFPTAVFYTNQIVSSLTTSVPPGTYGMRVVATTDAETKNLDTTIEVYSGIQVFVAYPNTQPVPGQFEFVIDIEYSMNVSQLAWSIVETITDWTIVRSASAHDGVSGGMDEDLIAGYSDIPQGRNFFIATPNDPTNPGTSFDVSVQITSIADPLNWGMPDNDLGPQTPTIVNINIVM